MESNSARNYEDTQQVNLEGLDSREIVNLLTPEQKQSVLVDMLKDLSPGRKPLDVFLAMAEKMVLTCIEVAPLRTNPETGRTEVLLTQRPEEDVTWVGQWHVPGAVILSSDDNSRSTKEGGPYKDAVDRVFGGELNNSIRPISPQVEMYTEFRDTPRSKELTVVTYFEVEGEPIVGAFFPIGDTIEGVPGKVIDHQNKFIIDCARDFEAKKNASRTSSLQQ